MATHALIAYEHPDTRISTAYCHMACLKYILQR